MTGILPIALGLFLAAPASADEKFEKARIIILEGGSGWLSPAEVRVPANLQPLARARASVEALLARGPGLGGPFPEGTRLLHLFLGPGATAVVDLGPEALRTPSGASSESLAAQSLVLTLTANLPGVEKVLIMIEGKKRETLAGHLGLLEALKPMENLVRKTETHR